MQPVDLVVCLLVVQVALVVVAQRVNISYPIVLVIGGLLLALFPRLPEVRLEPSTVFLVFLPPLLYWDAVNSSWRDFRDNWHAISLLAIWLVFATTMAVMVVAHFLLGLLWGPAFVLGAVLGPTDTVAVAAILERFSLPRQLLTVLRGESLLNDASALVLYETALHVTQSKTYVWGSLSTGFFVAAGGGIIIGLAIGWLMLQVRRLAPDTLLGSTISLLTGFAAFLPADALHLSGVLAVVAAGFYLNWHDPRMVSAKTRLQSIATWEVITFLLNGLLFILIGLQLRTILGSFSSGSLRSVIRSSLVISGTVILVRIIWVFIFAYVPRLRKRQPSSRKPQPGWRQPALISWVGIRGGISLAAALAIPTSLGDGSPFPGRSEILILTFAVILATLVLQGLSLPGLLRWLKLAEEGTEPAEEQLAQKAMAGAALRFLKLAPQGDEIHRRIVYELQQTYQKRAELITMGPKPRLGIAEVQYRNIKSSLAREVIGVQRTTLIDLRDCGSISDDMLRHHQLVLDLEELQLDEQERHQV
ncbi:MAG: Na+/H+ antiporter [Verrucomicrobia bacterium]|nr:Na+/H+ antiporter [Verrucomicrobiota bacterium]